MDSHTWEAQDAALDPSHLGTASQGVGLGHEERKRNSSDLILGSAIDAHGIEAMFACSVVAVMIPLLYYITSYWVF